MFPFVLARLLTSIFHFRVRLGGPLFPLLLFSEHAAEVVVKAGSEGKEPFRRPLSQLKIMRLALLAAQSIARPPFSHGPCRGARG